MTRELFGLTFFRFEMKKVSFHEIVKLPFIDKIPTKIINFK